MNKLFIIGNLTRDPELRSTKDGIPVATFTVAVNRRQRRTDASQPEADFFRVTVWRQQAENCARYLSKGRKVCVVGTVSVNTYTGNDGVMRASLEVTADDVEFLSPRGEGATEAPRSSGAESGGFVEVDNDDLPF